ncbi:MAG: hypothetical protein QX199_11540 [Methylococcaceae bacterium]
MTICSYCYGPITEKGRGRIPVFCSAACKQANHRLTKVGLHLVAERNRHLSRIESVRNKPLRNVTGAGLNQAQPLRKSGTFSQVDWVES